MPKIATDVIEQTKTQSLWFVTPKFISQGQLTITYTQRFISLFLLLSTPVQGRFCVGDSMTHKAEDSDSDIKAYVKHCSKVRAPLKLGLERMTQEAETGHNVRTL